MLIPEFSYNCDDICKKISASKKLGKRNFIVIVSEGVGGEVAPALAKKIENETGIETKFARFAHIVRGGTPTLHDRVMASKMGVFAVEELLAGDSNIVICMRNGDIVSTNINYALILDRMYKNKLKDGDLDAFDEQTLAKMRAAVAERRAEMEILHNVSETISL